MPMRGSDDLPGFQVEISPQSPDSDAWLTRLLSSVAQYESDRLDRALVDFTEVAAQFLGRRGEAVFELLWPTSGGSQLPEGLAILPPTKVARRPRHYAQLIPEADRRLFDGAKRILIPTSKVWRVRLPSSLGSSRQHRRMLRDLSHTPFGLGSQVERVPEYDFAAHHRTIEAFQERATNRWGSVPSLGRIDDTTEFYYFARILWWRRSQALLREHLIREINQLLYRLEVPGRLEVSGLTTAAEISRMLDSLHAGQVDVRDAMAVGRF